MRILELSSQQVTNRRNVKWAVHQISVENGNGCNFKEPYVTNNIETAKNMMLYATFLDTEENNAEKRVYSDHGEEVDGDGMHFPNTDIVGCATDAYVQELEINGEKGTYLVAEGYLQEDKYPAFVQELEEELNNGNAPKTSIEIVAKKDNEGIVYESGKWTATNRVPTEYDYNGSCFVLNPSDKNAILLELNSQRKENEMDIFKKGKKIELNELSYDEISSLIMRAFNKTMESDSWYDYWIYKLYPQSSRVILYRYEDGLNQYYMTTYTIEGTSVSIGDITKVEEDWKPVNEETVVEVNASHLKEALNIKSDKGGNKDMDEKILQELNGKIEDLTKKVGELESKNTELNSAVVNANKALEEKTKEIENVNGELNSLRQFKNDKDAETKKTEINSYFETEIKKNGFTEAEVNSLKADYVDKMDFEGLKKAEANLCVKKVKELNSVKAEINSKKDDDLFIAIHNNEKSDEDFSDLF